MRCMKEGNGKGQGSDKAGGGILRRGQPLFISFFFLFFCTLGCFHMGVLGVVDVDGLWTQLLRAWSLRLQSWLHLRFL